MYLFETYVDTEDNPEPDQNELRNDLSLAGFGDAEIDRALDSEFEMDRLDASCRGYIAYLEQIAILSVSQREILIDRLLALETDDIDVEQIKWVVLMVLFSQPGQEQAYAQMEDLVFEENTGMVH